MLKVDLSGMGEGGIGSIITGLARDGMSKSNPSGGSAGTGASLSTAGVIGAEYTEGDGVTASLVCGDMFVLSRGLTTSDCCMTSSDIWDDTAGVSGSGAGYTFDCGGCGGLCCGYGKDDVSDCADSKTVESPATLEGLVDSATEYNGC